MSSPSGTLQCTVEYARDLIDKEWFGKQDPYTIVALGRQIFRTKTHKDGGTSPVWGETFAFNVGAESELVITVKDENWGKDTLLGSAAVTLATVRARGEERIQAALHLKDKEKGVVSLLLRFTPQGAPAAAGSAAAGFTAVQQPPLQQAAVRVTALPGYGTFRPTGAPAPTGLPYGMPAGAVYGQPMTATGTPSPYSPKPTFPSPPAAPHFNGLPHGFRSAPTPDVPVASESAGGSGESPGPSTSTCEGDGAVPPPTAGASEAPAAAPSPAPPPLPDLQSLHIDDARGREMPSSDAGDASPPAASVSETAAAVLTGTAANDAAANPAAIPEQERRAPPVGESDPVESSPPPAPVESAAPAVPALPASSAEPQLQPLQAGVDPKGLGEDSLPMTAPAGREQTAAAVGVESHGPGPEPQPRSQGQSLLQPSAVPPAPLNTTSGSEAARGFDTTAPCGLQVTATMTPVSAAPPPPPPQAPSLQSPPQHFQPQYPQGPYQMPCPATGQAMPPPYCGPPPYNAPNPYGTPCGALPPGYGAAGPYGGGAPPQLPSSGQPPQAWPAPQAARPPLGQYAGYPPYGPGPAQPPPYNVAPPPGYPVEQHYGQSSSLPYGQPAAYGGYGAPPGYPPASGHCPNPYAYPPIGFPPPGGSYAEEDRMARHALPRYGTGKTSPSRQK